MPTVTDRLDVFIEATVELRDVRNRLAALEEERALLEGKAERLLQTLAAEAAIALGGNSVPAVPPPPLSLRLASFATSPTLTERILAFLAARPDQMYGATEVATGLGLTDESSVNTIRGTLSRLNADGRIEKMGYGKYRAKQEEKESGSPVSE